MYILCYSTSYLVEINYHFYFSRKYLFSLKTYICIFFPFCNTNWKGAENGRTKHRTVLTQVKCTRVFSFFLLKYFINSIYSWWYFVFLYKTFKVLIQKVFRTATSLAVRNSRHLLPLSKTWNWVFIWSFIHNSVRDHTWHKCIPEIDINFLLKLCAL